MYVKFCKEEKCVLDNSRIADEGESTQNYWLPKNLIPIKNFPTESETNLWSFLIWIFLFEEKPFFFERKTHILWNANMYKIYDMRLLLRMNGYILNYISHGNFPF